MSRHPEPSSVAIWLDLAPEALAALARRLAPHALVNVGLREIAVCEALRRSIIYACFMAGPGENNSDETRESCDE